MFWGNATPEAGDREAAARIARLVADPPPAWLVPVIEIVVLPRIRKEIAGFSSYPKRSILRPKVEATIKTIEAVIAHMKDRDVWSQIVANSPAGSESKARLRRVAGVVLNDLPVVLTGALTKARDNVEAGKGGGGGALHPKVPRACNRVRRFRDDRLGRSPWGRGARTL